MCLLGKSAVVSHTSTPEYPQAIASVDSESSYSSTNYTNDTARDSVDEVHGLHCSSPAVSCWNSSVKHIREHIARTFCLNGGICCADETSVHFCRCEAGFTGQRCNEGLIHWLETKDITLDPEPTSQGQVSIIIIIGVIIACVIIIAIVVVDIVVVRKVCRKKPTSKRQPSTEDGQGKNKKTQAFLHGHDTSDKEISEVNYITQNITDIVNNRNIEKSN